MKLFLPIEFIIITFSICTLIFHIALCTRIPAGTIQNLWALTVALSFIAYLPRFIRRFRSRGDGSRFHWWILVIALAWATPMLFVMRQNNDDLTLYHRVVWQLNHLDQPFTLEDTTHGLPDLPAISYLHITTSYEPLVGLLANLFHLDPLLAYHNTGAFFGPFLLVVVYALLYRRFRFTRSQAILATLVSLCFLLVDTGTGRSFGRLVFVMWTAKNILWLVVIPLTILLSLRFLSRPTPWRFLTVFLMGIGSVGLTNSGIFLFPGTVFCISVAYLVNGGWSAKRFRRALLLNAASIYCVAFAAATVLHIIPALRDREAWAVGWPASWYRSLALVIPNWQTLARDLVIALVVVPACLMRSLRKLPVIYTLTACLVFMTPWTGPAWLAFLQSGNYWRVLYLIPLPWFAGCLARWLPMRRNILVLVVISAVVLDGISWFNQIHSGAVRKPWSYSFDSEVDSFSRRIAAEVDGRLLLAREDVVVVLGLENPQSRFYSTRFLDTRHIFANADRKKEGVDRSLAQSFVEGKVSPEAQAAFELALENKVDAIATKREMLPLIQTILEKRQPGSWKVTIPVNSYMLLLRS